MTHIRWQWARPFPRTGRGCTALVRQCTTRCLKCYAPLGVIVPGARSQEAEARMRRHSSFVIRRSSVAGAHPAQRAALAIQAVPGALARVDEHTPRAWPILARAGRQAVMNALLDDQRVEV